jgi:phytoene dehydrogenase-like protein
MPGCAHRIRGDADEEDITGVWDGREQEAMADRVEAQVERYAPGFPALIRARRIIAPPAFEATDTNLHGGAINRRQPHTLAPHAVLMGLGRPAFPSRCRGSQWR